MRRYPTLLFDLDGTLIDSLGLIVDSYAWTLAAHGLPAVPRAYWLAGVGRPLREQLRPFATSEDHLDALVATYRVYNDAHHDERVSAFPGVRDALAGAVARGARVGVVTSKVHARAVRGLEVTGLDGYVRVVIGCDDVSRHKPHPEPVLAALARLDAAPAEALLVGDSVHDLASARAAGAATGAALWGAGGEEEMRACAPDHWFDRPEELAALV